MRTVSSILLVSGCLAFFGCGPSAEEVQRREKEKESQRLWDVKREAEAKNAREDFDRQQAETKRKADEETRQVRLAKEKGEQSKQKLLAVIAEAGAVKAPDQKFPPLPTNLKGKAIVWNEVQNNLHEIDALVRSDLGENPLFVFFVGPTSQKEISTYEVMTKGDPFLKIKPAPTGKTIRGYRISASVRVVAWPAKTCLGVYPFSGYMPPTSLRIYTNPIDERIENSEQSTYHVRDQAVYGNFEAGLRRWVEERFALPGALEKLLTSQTPHKFDVDDLYKTSPEYAVLPAVPYLAERLRQAQGDEPCYQWIRTLQFYCRTEMGPDDYGSFLTNPAMWKSRWLAWAEQQR
jgi:hypothetical protein